MERKTRQELALGLAEVEVRIHILETELEESRAERGTIIQALVSLDDAGDRPGHVASASARSPETSERAHAIEAYLRTHGSATFTAVLAELRRAFGDTMGMNHAIAVLKRPQFRRVGRGVYALRENAATPSDVG